MTTTETEAAAAVRIGARLGQRKRAELLELMRLWFVRAGPWLRARHQARSRWFHQRARLARNIEIALVS